MELTNERKESWCRYDAIMPDNEKELLLRIGRERVVNDEEALINYAVNSILMEFIEKNPIKKRRTK